MTAHRINVIFRTAIVAELVLIATTWRLWLCAAEFPVVPLFGIFLQIPLMLVRLVSLTFVAALLVAAFTGRGKRLMPGRRISAVSLLLAGLAVCCNQHCLQPWHWLFMLTMSFRMILSNDDVLNVLRRLLPCIYVFAAVSRFGPNIDSGMSRSVVTVLLESADLTHLTASEETMFWACLLSTMLELSAGLLLWISRTQSVGRGLAVAMHLILITALGPWGLNQHPAVIIWNAFLALWVIFLFPVPFMHQKSPSASVTAAAGLCITWSTLALFGVTDSWTGWQLYSPRPETLHLRIHSAAAAELPASVAPFVSDSTPLDEWHTVRLDRWSLAAAGVPIYPQARFQLAVAGRLIRDMDSSQHVRIGLNVPDPIRWWRRTTVSLSGKPAIKEATQTCRLNATAR
ncbi:MAG: hypothetical protein MK110_05295 [Fuerstiella sp.]|nr:hypothetical protein [Fuerstiella sp.]